MATEQKQAKLKVGGVEYDISDLDDREHIILSHVIDLRQRIRKARFLLEEMKVAENTYASSLVESLSEEKEPEFIKYAVTCIQCRVIPYKFSRYRGTF